MRREMRSLNALKRKKATVSCAEFLPDDLSDNKVRNGDCQKRLLSPVLVQLEFTFMTVNGEVYTNTKDLNACSHRDGGAATYFHAPFEVNTVRLTYLLECQRFPMNCANQNLPHAHVFPEFQLLPQNHI